MIKINVNFLWKADPVKTGAVACDVGKLEPGKLVQDEEIDDTGKDITDAQNEVKQDEITDSYSLFFFSDI